LVIRYKTVLLLFLMHLQARYDLKAQTLLDFTTNNTKDYFQ